MGSEQAECLEVEGVSVCILRLNCYASGSACLRKRNEPFAQRTTNITGSKRQVKHWDERNVALNNKHTFL